MDPTQSNPRVVGPLVGCWDGEPWLWLLGQEDPANFKYADDPDDVRPDLIVGGG